MSRCGTLIRKQRKQTMISLEELARDWRISYCLLLEIEMGYKSVETLDQEQVRLFLRCE